jgi:hypothetical protein
MALPAERALPASVLGPVLALALARLAASFLALIALIIVAAYLSFVPDLYF